jgi:hypothetical protein
MSVNRYRPYLIILPEDRATEEIANGFIEVSKVNGAAIRIERPARGWPNVVTRFTKEIVSEMNQYSDAMIVLLIDFDDNEKRLSFVEKDIPENLRNRVFIIGIWSDPEALRRNTKKNFETIGETLANNCADNTHDLWNHDLLKHNETELERMRVIIKPFLFI